MGILYPIKKHEISKRYVWVSWIRCRDFVASDRVVFLFRTQITWAIWLLRPLFRTTEKSDTKTLLGCPATK